VSSFKQRHNTQLQQHQHSLKQQHGPATAAQLLHRSLCSINNPPVLTFSSTQDGFIASVKQQRISCCIHAQQQHTMGGGSRCTQHFPRHTISSSRVITSF